MIGICARTLILIPYQYYIDHYDTGTPPSAGDAQLVGSDSVTAKSHSLPLDELSHGCTRGRVLISNRVPRCALRAARSRAPIATTGAATPSASHCGGTPAATLGSSSLTIVVRCSRYFPTAVWTHFLARRQSFEKASSRAVQIWLSHHKAPWSRPSPCHASSIPSGKFGSPTMHVVT